jgi:hypothetical protein
MRRQLQNRAEDLAERLLIADLEMRRSRTLPGKLAAYRDFGSAVDRLDQLRRDIEEFVHWDAKESILADLDRQVASIMRSPAYRVVEWLDRYCRVHWYIGQSSLLATQC